VARKNFREGRLRKGWFVMKRFREGIFIVFIVPEYLKGDSIVIFTGSNKNSLFFYFIDKTVFQIYSPRPEAGEFMF